MPASDDDAAGSGCVPVKSVAQVRYHPGGLLQTRRRAQWTVRLLSARSQLAFYNLTEVLL